jgi:hypothetical protein
MFDLVKKVTLTSLMCTTLFFSAQSSAEIIDADWLSAGDKNAVIDTDTGLQWLDITLLNGRSIDYARSLTQTNPLYSGWRLPTFQEVEQLMHNISPEFDTFSGTWVYHGISFDDRKEWKYFASNSSPSFFYGLYQGTIGEYDENYTYTSGCYFSETACVNKGVYAHATTWVSSGRAPFLVSDSPTATLSAIENPLLIQNNINAVPEPSAIALLGIGLLGFAGFRKKKAGLLSR